MIFPGKLLHDQCDHWCHKNDAAKHVCRNGWRDISHQIMVGDKFILIRDMDQNPRIPVKRLKKIWIMYAIPSHSVQPCHKQPSTYKLGRHGKQNITYEPARFGPPSSSIASWCRRNIGKPYADLRLGGADSVPLAACS